MREVPGSIPGTSNIILHCNFTVCMDHCIQKRLNIFGFVVYKVHKQTVKLTFNDI